MGLKKVEFLKDKIREYLLAGHSMAATEKVLGLTKNDIQRYYERVTGEDPKKLVEEAKEREILNEVREITLNAGKEPIKAISKKSEVENLSKKIEDLEIRVKKLEEKIEKSIPNNTYDAFSFTKEYKEGEKVLYSVRLLKDLKYKLTEKANEEGISVNQLINAILLKYFDE